MPTEKLIVELDAKTQKLDTALTKTDKKLKKVDGSTQKADRSFAKFTKVAAQAAVAVTAVAASIAIAIREANNFAKELEVAANRAGESVETMQSLAFASNTVGVSLEKLGDIAKDTNEKVGEFLATGGGGFQDFADVLGLTSIQAREAAEEFESMSGPDVLQEMVNRMQEAGISANRMSFALEGMASDTTDLIPLLENSGEKLKGLRDEFDLLNITLSAADLEKIKEVGIELDKATTTFSAEGKQLIADYSEELIKAINLVVTFGQKTTALFNLTATQFGGLVEISKAAINDLINDTDTFSQVMEERAQKTQEAINELFGTDIFDIANQAGKDTGNAFNDGVLEILITGGKRLTEWEKLNSKQRLDISSKFIKAAGILSNEFLEDNKAINAGLVIADTAAGVMRAFATSSNIYEAFANAAIVAATGLVQLNNVLSASKGGGSIGGDTGTAATNTPIPETPEIEDTSSLELSERGDISQDIVVRFATDTGDELLDALANGLNEKQRRGSR